MKHIATKTYDGKTYEMYELEEGEAMPRNMAFWWVHTILNGGWTFEDALKDFKSRTLWANDCKPPVDPFKKFWWAVEQESNEYGIISP